MRGLHDPANVQQTSSHSCVFWIHLLEVCWTFAGSCKHLITRRPYNCVPGYIIISKRCHECVINSPGAGTTTGAGRQRTSSVHPRWLQPAQPTGCVIVDVIIQQPISGAVISARQTGAGDADLVGRPDSRRNYFKLSSWCRTTTFSTSGLHDAPGTRSPLFSRTITNSRVFC